VEDKKAFEYLPGSGEEGTCFGSIAGWAVRVKKYLFCKDPSPLLVRLLSRH